MNTDIAYMKAALEEAKKAQDRDEVPIGAIMVHIESGKIISAQGNRTRELNDPSAHAEILCIRETGQIEQAQRMPDYDLFVTLEPCTMCAAAISFARIRRIVIGAEDPKGGGILHGAKFYNQPTCHHKPNIISGVLEQDCADILRNFFKNKRK